MNENHTKKYEIAPLPAARVKSLLEICGLQARERGDGRIAAGSPIVDAYLNGVFLGSLRFNPRHEAAGAEFGAFITSVIRELKALGAPIEGEDPEPARRAIRGLYMLQRLMGKYEEGHPDARRFVSTA